MIDIRATSDSVRVIGRAVTQLDETTQQNSALVEESAAAAESLKDMAARLAEAVGGFRLSVRAAAQAAPVRAAQKIAAPRSPGSTAVAVAKPAARPAGKVAPTVRHGGADDGEEF